MNIGRIIKRLAFPVAVGAFVVLFVLERRRPLRGAVESRASRVGRNLAVAATAAVTVYLVEQPVARKAAELVEKRGIGLLKVARLPKWFEQFAAVLLLDHTLYLWHYLTHRIPVLWRFHVVHHADLDLDTTTALRFHFGELIISVAWRAAQIVVIGVSPASLRAWQNILLPLVVFHHSNIELPKTLERVLSKLLVTPRLHGIHHSVVQAETDSNWSSGLSVWDRLHGTFRDISEHDGVKIGVPAFPLSRDVELIPLLKIPFVGQPPSLELPTSIVTDER